MESYNDKIEPQRKSEMRQIAEVMAHHGVEYIVIGGQAESLMGSPRVTFDVDLCYRRSPLNLQRMADALKQLGAALRGGPKELPFLLDAKTLEMGSNFTFDTPIVALDILGWVEPLGDYEQLLKNSEAYPLGEVTVNAIDLNDLIRIKKHVNRLKDQSSLLQLLAIKRLREETGMR